MITSIVIKNVSAGKLSQFLLAGTFVLVIGENPTRQVLGACLKIDRDKFVLLTHVHTKIIPSLEPSQPRTGRESEDSDTSSDLPSKGSQRSTLMSSGVRDINGFSASSSSSSRSDTGGDDDFSPWDTMDQPICFQVCLIIIILCLHLQFI